MRWLIRLLILWAILGGLFYMFGLPVVIDSLSAKAKTDGYDQCITQLTNERTIGSPNSPLNQQQGVEYCQCVSGGLTLTKEDIFEIVEQRVTMKPQTTPKGFTERAQQLANTCTANLQRSLGFLPAEQPQTAPSPDSGDMVPLQ